MRNFLFISFLLFCLNGFSQQLSATQLIHNLKPFWDFSEDLNLEINDDFKKDYFTVVEQSYGFIIVEIRQDVTIFARVQYQVNQDQLKIYNFYCSNQKQEKAIRKKFETLEGEFKWKANPADTFQFKKEVFKYLKIADRIAAFGNDMSAYPTNFERIILRQGEIKLIQSNHWNSKSIDHKDSYLMRDLSFKISLDKPLKKTEQLEFGAYYVGGMKVVFNDGSAKSQKGTGDKILNQIKIEMGKFEGK